MGFMDEVRKQLESMRAKAQQTQFAKTLRTPVTVSRPVAQVATRLASATPQRIVSQGVRQNAPLYKQAVSGFTGSSTFGLAPSFAPAPQGLAQKSAYGVGFAGGIINPLNPVTRVAAGLKTIKPVESAFRAVQKPLGTAAGKLIAKGGLTKFAGKGVANLSQGIPLTAAYALAKQSTGQKYTGKNLAGDVGTDLALGALIPGAGAAIPLLAGLSKKVVNSEIKSALKNEPGIVSLVGRIKNLPSLPAADQINLKPKLTSLLKSMLDEVSPTISKELKKIEVKNPELWEKQAVAALEDRLVTARDPIMSAGLQARAMGKLDTPKLSVEPKVPERIQDTLDAIREGRLVGQKRYAEAMRWQEQSKPLSVEPTGGNFTPEVKNLIKKGNNILSPEDFKQQRNGFITEDGSILHTGSSHEKALREIGYTKENNLPDFMGKNNVARVVNGSETYPGLNVQSVNPLSKNQITTILKSSPESGSFNYEIGNSQGQLKYSTKQELSNKLLEFTTPSKPLSVEPTGVKQVTPELPQSAAQTASKGITTPELTTQSQLKAGVDQVDNLKTSPSDSIILSPVQKITQALTEAKPIRGQQEALYAKARSQQAARLAGVGKSVSGEKGYFAQLGQLKGQLPKAQFEGVRSKIGQSDIDELFNMVEQKNIFSPFEKVNAKTALSKLLGAEGGQVPTKSELRLLAEVFPPEMIDAVLSNRTTFQKLMSLGSDVLNVPRSIMATGDLSAPLRQGIFLIGKPKQWAPAFKEMFKYAGSDKAYQGLLENIQARPTYKLMRQNKLALTDIGGPLSVREETFMSNLPEKIPVFGAIAKGSNRAYSGFLNKLRADVFDDMYKTASQQGLTKENPKLVEDMAKFINAATGRGTLGSFERATEILAQTAFAPRLIASRVQLLNPIYYAKLDPFVRKEALKSLLSFVGLGSTVLGIAKMGGAEVGMEPTSSDFGKIKVGNTRYDIWGGFQQYIKLASQLASGKITSSTSGKVMTLGEGYKPMTRKDILMRFFEGKESPVASFITGLMTGQTPTGEPMNIPAETISRFIPLMVQDLYDLYNEQGPKGIAMGIPGAFGVGSQTYGKTELVSGTNKVGQPTQQIRPLQDLPTKLAEKAFGQRPLGSTSSWNAEVWLDQFKKMSPEQKKQSWLELSKNPDLKKKVEDVGKARAKGITVQDEQLKLKGVASGDRAITISKTLNKAKTKEERNKLYAEYVRKGIITKDVAKQLPKLLKKY